MQNFWSRIVEGWVNAPRALKVGIAGGAIGFAALLMFLFMWAGAPQYELLYSDLSPADSAVVMDYLKQKNIPARTQAGGTIIEVPKELKDQARLELASQGLPKSGAPGYTRLDKSTFGMTQTMEQNTLRIALEEELQNTIQHLEPVHSARVHLTPGNASPFADSKVETSASIVLDLKSDASLSRDQVRGIVHLVSRSVEGLKPDNISVMDDNARPLWSGQDQQELSSDMVRLRRDAERAYAEDLRRNLQSELDRVLGPNKSSVVVRAELNLDKEEVQAQKVEPVDPNRPPVISETLSMEQLKGNEGAAGGAAGIASNRSETPIYPSGTTNPAGPGEYTRDDRVRNYEVSKQITHSTRAPGRVEKLTVGVLIDKETPQETVRSLQQWIETAIAVEPNSATRQVTVQRVEFDQSLSQQAEQERNQLAQAKKWELLWRLIPVFLLIAVAFFMARVIGKQLRRAALQTAPLSIAAGGEGALAGLPGLDVSVGDEGTAQSPDLTLVLSESGGAASPNRALSLRQSLPSDVAAIEEQVEPELLQIVQFANQKPEKVASIIRTWIKNE